MFFSICNTLSMSSSLRLFDEKILSYNFSFSESWINLRIFFQNSRISYLS